MVTFITVIHIITCVLLVLVVMIQSGKGAEISASFAGSSQTVFGASGGANFFTRFTSVAAAVFMCTSVALTLLGGQSNKSVFEGLAPKNAPITAPAHGAATTPAAPGQDAKTPAAPAQGAATTTAPAKGAVATPAQGAPTTATAPAQPAAPATK